MAILEFQSFYLELIVDAVFGEHCLDVLVVVVDDSSDLGEGKGAINPHVLEGAW